MAENLVTEYLLQLFHFSIQFNIYARYRSCISPYVLNTSRVRETPLLPHLVQNFHKRNTILERIPLRLQLPIPNLTRALVRFPEKT
jgi:hypothetical protein